MKIKSRSTSKFELMMTPMIDIVFQLLIFFIMSFKIAAQEGDFNIKMPLAGASAGAPSDDLPPMKLRLNASPGGQLAGIALGERRFESFAQLHRYIISEFGSDRGAASAVEIELDCDYNLRYEEVVNAVSAISGYVSPDGQIVKLIEKLKFAQIRKE
ncbi:MAG: biopolymer transporter ExbD [Pirellulales bacterium]